MCQPANTLLFELPLERVCVLFLPVPKKKRVQKVRLESDFRGPRDDRFFREKTATMRSFGVM